MITVNFDSLGDMVNFAKNLLAINQSEPVIENHVAAPNIAAPVQTQATIQQAPVNQKLTAAAPVQTQAPIAQNSSTVAPVQTTAKTYTLDELAQAAMPLMDSGRQAALLNLINQFGVDSLPALSPEQYGAFATALRGLGAQI